MGNLFKAHIFKERTRGPREEVKLKLFNLDDSPIEIGGGSEHTAWLPVANADMQNGWTNHASHPVRYRVRASGVVEWQGHLTPGVTGTIFVLPPEARPLDLADSFNSWKCHTKGATENAASTVSITEDSMICNALQTGVIDYINIGCILYSID